MHIVQVVFWSTQKKKQGTPKYMCRSVLYPCLGTASCSWVIRHFTHYSRLSTHGQVYKWAPECNSGLIGY